MSFKKKSATFISYTSANSAKFELIKDIKVLAETIRMKQGNDGWVLEWQERVN